MAVVQCNKTAAVEVLMKNYIMSVDQSCVPSCDVKLRSTKVADEMSSIMIINIIINQSYLYIAVYRVTVVTSALP